MQTNQVQQWVTAREVCARFRFSRSTLWKKVRQGALPQPHHRGRLALWKAEEIVAAEEHLIQPPRAA